jgi:hypothetical protein
VLLAVALTACSSDEEQPTNSAQTNQQAYNVLTVSGRPYVGENRVAFAIQDPENLPVDAQNVKVRFFRVQGQTGTLAGEADAVKRRFENFFPHVHADNTTHIHTDRTIFYTVDSFNFDTPGLWGFLVAATLPDGREIQAQTDAFEVTPNAPWPTPGRPVPATHNKTLDEVANISEIDTSVPPRPFMHQVSIDAALADKKPFVVTFSTPAFCKSAVCGPVTDVVASLYPKYGSRMPFIHVEPYDIEAQLSGPPYELLPIVLEWGIPSEPWTFVVGADGRVVADFGGLFAPEELEAAIQKALNAQVAFAVAGSSDSE